MYVRRRSPRESTDWGVAGREYFMGDEADGELRSGELLGEELAYR